LLPRHRALTNMLLAPAVGAALTVICIFLVNRCGLPVSRFAWSLATMLALSATGLLLTLRPSVQLRAYAPFAGIILVALFLTGRPLLEFGFEWLSFCNDDMANYCLRAQRLQNNGFWDVPKADELVQGKDYSQFFWFMDVPGMTRAGSDLVLAWVASITGLTVHQAFMPVVLAFHLLLISSTGALVLGSGNSSGAALLTCVL